MEPGYLIDEGDGTRAVANWVAGEPERSNWTGLKLRGKRKVAVTTFRCRHCGDLES